MEVMDMEKEVKVLGAKTVTKKAQKKVEKEVSAKLGKDGCLHLKLKNGEDRVFNPNDEATLMKIVTLYKNMKGENVESYRAELEALAKAESDEDISISGIEFMYKYSMQTGLDIDNCIGENTCMAEFGTPTPSLILIKSFLEKLKPVYNALIEIKEKEWSSIFNADERDNK